MTNPKPEAKPARCKCVYTSERRVGICLRCAKMMFEERAKGRTALIQRVRKKVQGLKKETNNVTFAHVKELREKYNQALDDILTELQKLEEGK